MNLPWKLDHWWKDLAVSLMAGTEALGVFLDRSQLTLAHVQQTLKGIRVEHVIQLPWDSNIEDMNRIFQETITPWNLKSCPVALAVSAELGFCRRVVFPLATMENLSQVMAYELDRLLPLPANQLYYDFQIQAVTDTEVQIMLMALPRNRVEHCLELFAETGLRAVAIQMEPVAASNALAGSGRSMPGSWLLLHLDSTFFEILHLQNGIVKSYESKRILGSTELTGNIMTQIRRLIAAGPQPKVIAIYGSHKADFRKGTSEQDDLEIIYPNNISSLAMLPDTGLDAAIPAVGAALACLGQDLLGINLLPPSERTPVKFSRFSTTTVLLAVFLVLFVLWGVGAIIHAPVELYRLNRQIAKLAPEAQKLEGLLKESQQLANQMASLHKIGNSPEKLKILKDLTRVIPDNTWLINLRLIKQNLEMDGMSNSASDLIPLLDKSGWLNKTEFASPIVTDVNKFEHFKIKGEIKSLAPGS